MNEQFVAALARALDAPIPPDRVAAVAAQLEGQLASRGGLSAEELEDIEPATVFEPGWDA
jgi:hypothetical protein